MINSGSSKSELMNATNEELILLLVGMGLGCRMYKYEYKQAGRIAGILKQRGVISDDAPTFEEKYIKRTSC